jgi:hypothetical protein
MIRLESRGGVKECFRCENLEGVYRCADCLGTGLWCQSCLLSDHIQHPLHRVEVRLWQYETFRIPLTCVS